MTTSSIDIIVPVWNNPFETRACLSAILTHSPETRLVVVDNGSNRETQLMLEEFSEPLGERGLFIASDRNLGLVPAINMGLNRSDSDYAIIVRPHVCVTGGWLDGLFKTMEKDNVGIVSPVFTGAGAPHLFPATHQNQCMETFNLSFNTLLLKREMSMVLGDFNEDMDGGEWCLKDYIRRALGKGYHTCVTFDSLVSCGEETVFGSKERRQAQTLASHDRYHKQWGASRDYAIYFGKNALAESLTDTMATVLEYARLGHRFTLLLHRRQATDFKRLGWGNLHTGITLQNLSRLMPQRDLLRKLTTIRATVPDLIPLQGVENVSFPGTHSAIPFSQLATTT